MSEQQASERTDRNPFVGPLKDTGLSTHEVIKTIEGVPDKFVRTGSSERVAIKEGKPGYSAAILEKYKTGKKLFSELAGIKATKKIIQPEADTASLL